MISDKDATKLGVTMKESSLNKNIYYMILPIKPDEKEFIEFLDKLDKQAKDLQKEQKKDTATNIQTPPLHADKHPSRKNSKLNLEKPISRY